MASLVAKPIDARAPVWSLLHGLAGLALVLRLIVAWWSERISYPDELFQYLEQAHRLVYGYGFIPWEYRFGVRNWLLPGALAGLLETLQLVGLSKPLVYVPVLKSVFAAISVSVVYAGYAVGRSLYSERAGRLAAIFAAIWYELIYYSTVPTPEVLGANAILGALALAMAPLTQWRAVLIGLLLGLAVALRLQYAVPAAGLCAIVVILWGWRNTMLLAASGAAVCLLAPLLDAWTWGTPFASYYNSVLLNLVHNVSAIWGTSPPIWYVQQLLVASQGLFAIAAVYGVLTWQRCWPILVLIVCVLLPHSLIPHKEYRFVFLAIPLLLILLAGATAWATRLVPALERGLVAGAILAFSVLSAVKGDAAGVLSRNDRLLAALNLSRRGDVVAVADLSTPWHDAGGFYYLHHDVPVYFSDQIQGLADIDIQELASHVLVRSEQSTLPGFKVAARFGEITVLEQATPRRAYRRLERDGREPGQGEVENRFTPTVRPRF